MSKQGEAKAAQGYIDKVVPKVCSGCRHYKSDMFELKGAFGESYKEEKNKRCGIGGFAVKKLGTCNEWAPLIGAKQ